jgi:hypothetical protein
MRSSVDTGHWRIDGGSNPGLSARDSTGCGSNPYSGGGGPIVLGVVDELGVVVGAGMLGRTCMAAAARSLSVKARCG